MASALQKDRNEARADYTIRSNCPAIFRGNPGYLVPGASALLRQLV
jgi:hypothetical protein